MAVLFLTHKYPPSIGGMEKQSYELINGYSKYEKVFSITYSGLESKLVFFAKLYFRVKKVIHENPEISTIHLNDGLMATFCWWIKKATGCKVFVTLHGLDVTYPLALYQKWLLPLLIKLDGYICVSEFTKLEASTRGFPADKLYVVNNGVDHNWTTNKTLNFKQKNLKLKLRKKIGIEEDTWVLISIGRPVKRKGFSWFIKEVLPLFKNRKIIFYRIGENSNPGFYSFLLKILPPKARLEFQLLFGLPSDIDDISKAIKGLPPNIKVYQPGKLPMNQVLNLMLLSDLFVMPNIQFQGDCEGFGIVALEAAILHKVVLASDLEGIKDAVSQGNNGLKVKAGDAKAWFDEINNILENKAFVQIFEDKASKYTMNHFSWDKMVIRYREIMSQHIYPIPENKIPLLASIS